MLGADRESGQRTSNPFGWLAIAILSFVAAPVFAQDVPITISLSSNKQVPFKDGNLYAVDIICQRLGGNIEKSIQKDWFSNPTRTHAIAISKSAAAADGKVPADSIAVIPVFSAGYDKANETNKTFDFRDCKKSFVVNGSQSIYLVATVAVADNFSNSIFATVATNAFEIVSPLFTFFMDVPIHHSVTDKITNLKSIQNPLTNILTALNRGQNNTKQFNLRLGTYVITTQFSKVTVSVRQMKSIVDDPNTQFRKDLRDQIFGAPGKLNLATLELSCRVIRAGLTQNSFTARQDVAYALIAIAATAGANKNEIVNCLTWDYAPIAASFSDSIWAIFPVGLRFTSEQVAEILPPNQTDEQPSFNAIRSRLYDTVVALAQYGRNSPPPESAISRARELFAASVKLIDKTSGVVIGDIGNNPPDLLLVLKKFIDKGYIRFGCYAETTSITDKDIDGAPAMFLVFNAPNNAEKAEFNKALALRPLYVWDEQSKTQRIATLIVSDNRAYITATLQERGYDCNGFSVDKPKSS